MQSYKILIKNYRNFKIVNDVNNETRTKEDLQSKSHKNYTVELKF